MEQEGFHTRCRVQVWRWRRWDVWRLEELDHCRCPNVWSTTLSAANGSRSDSSDYQSSVRGSCDSIFPATIDSCEAPHASKNCIVYVLVYSSSLSRRCVCDGPRTQIPPFGIIQTSCHTPLGCRSEK